MGDCRSGYGVGDGDGEWWNLLAGCPCSRGAGISASIGFLKYITAGPLRA